MNNYTQERDGAKNARFELKSLDNSKHAHSLIWETVLEPFDPDLDFPDSMVALFLQE